MEDAEKFRKRSEIYSLIAVIVAVIAIAALTQPVSASLFSLFGEPVEETQKTTPPGDEKILLIHGFMDTNYTPWWGGLKITPPKSDFP